MTHPFLSEEWMEAAHGIREKYADEIPEITAVIKINQVITRKMLSKKDITCDIANNGTEAIKLARANDYDGILMDIHMPGISGVEATEEIRKFDVDTPIIALTAISLDDSLEAFYAAGCNDVVTKPFKPELFYEKIGENIVEHKMRKSFS